jgi:hypothetical protein
MQSPRRTFVHVVTVSAYFPELKGSHCRQQARGRGSSVRAATARAFAALLRSPGLKRKRFTKYTSEICVGKAYD